MSTDSTKAMTLEKVRDVLRKLGGKITYVDGYKAITGNTMADAIDAHLAPREVSDEDVARALDTFYNGSEWRHDYKGEEWKIKDCMRAALQADRQRGGGVVPSERVYAPLPSDADEYDRGHVDGWNACRQALLAQRGQVREGLHECPTCGGPCDMFEEEGTFEIAYIYRSTSK